MWQPMMMMTTAPKKGAASMNSRRALVEGMARIQNA